MAELKELRPTIKPKVLPSVDHYIELLDKAEKKVKEAIGNDKKGD